MINLIKTLHFYPLTKSLLYWKKSLLYWKKSLLYWS